MFEYISFLNPNFVLCAATNYKFPEETLTEIVAKQPSLSWSLTTRWDKTALSIYSLGCMLQLYLWSDTEIPSDASTIRTACTINQGHAQVWPIVIVPDFTTGWGQALGLPGLPGLIRLLGWLWFCTKINSCYKLYTRFDLGSFYAAATSGFLGPGNCGLLVILMLVCGNEWLYWWSMMASAGVIACLLAPYYDRVEPGPPIIRSPLEHILGLRYDPRAEESCTTHTLPGISGLSKSWIGAYGDEWRAKKEAASDPESARRANMWPEEIEREAALKGESVHISAHTPFSGDDSKISETPISNDGKQALLLRQPVQ